MSKVKGLQSPKLHLFDFDRFPPSVANLNPALTINGITKLPDFRFNGKDAGASIWNPWGYGQQLALQAGTAPTYNNGSPLLGNLDDGVKFNTGGYYKAGNNTFGDITTEDLVVEVVVQMQTSVGAICSKRTTGSGLQIYYTGAGIAAYIQDGSSNNGQALTAALPDLSWQHIIVFADRSGSIQIYTNGVAGTPAVISSVGTLTNSNAFSIGALPSGTSISNSAVAYLSLWKSSSWLDTHLQTTVASTRFAQLLGIYPQQARGTALPTSFTRATSAYLDKVESNGTRKLYQVGSGWLRACKQLASNGAEIKGLLAEAASSNLCLQSQTLNSWTPTNASAPATSIVVPSGDTLTTVTVHEDGTLATTHLLTSPNAGVLTSGINYVYSAFVKKINRKKGLLYLLLLGAGVAFSRVWDTDAATLVAVEGATTGGIIPMGNGWFRVWESFVAPAGVTQTFCRVFVTDDTGNASFDGLNQDSFAVFGVQLEAGNYPTSYIPTVASPVARNADVLEYKMDDGNLISGKGTMLMDVLLPNYSPVADGYLATLSNAGSSTVRISSSIKATSGVANDSIVNTTLQTNISGTTNIANGKKHTIRTVWDTNDAKLYVESAQEGSTDTSVSIPTITRLDLSDNAGTNQANALISNLKIFGKETLEK